jgi:hypothetical protein
VRFLGIDPGQSGGFAVLSEDGEPLLCRRMPDSEEEIAALVKECLTDGSGMKAYLEKVRSSPQMSKGSIFTFGMGYGGLRMALIFAGIPFEDVATQRWQRFIGVLDKTGARALGDVNITEKKNRHKAKAQELFPSLVVTHALADALLIAEYGRRMDRGFGADFLK